MYDIYEVDFYMMNNFVDKYNYKMIDDVIGILQFERNTP